MNPDSSRPATQSGGNVGSPASVAFFLRSSSRTGVYALADLANSMPATQSIRAFTETGDLASCVTAVR